MVKELVEKVIRLRNPAFAFDPAMDGRMLISLVCVNALGLLRGMRVLLRLRRPRWAVWGSGVTLRHGHRVRWGKWVRLGNHVELSGFGKEGITLGDSVGIGAFSRLIVSTSANDLGLGIHIGSRVGIGEFAYLGGAGGLEIGSDTIVGQYFSCHPENHCFKDLETPIRLQGVERKGIKIGANCWIGSKVTILDGVHIGDGCVIAAGAVVTSSFPAHSIIGGVPARLLNSRNAL